MQRPRLLPSLINKHPLAVLVFAVLFTIFLATGIPSLTMRPVFEGDLPANDPVVAANQKYTFYFGKDEFAYLALVSDSIYHPSTLAKIAAITDDLNSLNDVLREETVSLATVRRVSWRPWGLDVRRYLSPLPVTSEDVERLRKDIRLDDDVYGKLVSTDETSTLLAIKLTPGYDRHQLYLSLHAIADRYSGPEQIYPFGRQVMGEEASMGIMHDLRVLGPAALLLMAGGMFLFFRSLRLTLGPVLMVIMSVVWTLGMMHYTGFSLSMVSSSMPPILVALGSSYMIHMIYSCGEQTTGAGDGVVEGVNRIARPIMLAAGTSMVGFITLVVFKILSIREFGICVAFGVMLAAFLSLVVLPSILILQKGILSIGGIRKFEFVDRILDGFSRIGLRHRYGVVLAGTLLVIVSLVGVSKIKIGFAPEEIFPRDHRARKVVSIFIDKFHGPYHFSVMFTTKEREGLKSPDVLRQIDAFQKFAEGLPKVKYSASIVNIVKRMNRSLNEDNPQFYAIPANEAMIAQLFLVYSVTHNPAQIENIVDYDNQRCKVAIMTTAIDSAELETIYQELVAYCRQNLTGDVSVDFGGQSLEWMAQNQYIVHGKLLNIAANTVLIWIICAFAFRSLRLGLISIIPLSMATLATFGLMGLLGIRLDTATVLITGISVGVGVDFAIHFISRLKRQSLSTSRIDEAVERTMSGAGRAIIFDATSNLLGFMTFMFSGFAPVRNLGVLVCFTMVHCVVLTLILIPTIIALVPVPFRHAGKGTIFLRAQSEGDDGSEP